MRAIRPSIICAFLLLPSGYPRVPRNGPMPARGTPWVDMASTERAHQGSDADSEAARELIKELQAEGERSGVKRLRYDASGRIASILLSSSSATESNLTVLRHFPSLTSLTVNCPTAYIGNGGLSAIAEVRSLEELRLRGASASIGRDFGVAIAHLKGLSHLSIQEIDVDPAFLDSLTTLTALRTLAITYSPSVSDSHITRIVRGAPHIQELDISGTSVTDDCLADLANSAQLRRLIVWHTQITAAAIRRSKIPQTVEVIGAK